MPKTLLLLALMSASFAVAAAPPQRDADARHASGNRPSASIGATSHVNGPTMPVNGPAHAPPVVAPRAAAFVGQPAAIPGQGMANGRRVCRTRQSTVFYCL